MSKSYPRVPCSSRSKRVINVLSLASYCSSTSWRQWLWHTHAEVPRASAHVRVTDGQLRRVHVRASRLMPRLNHGCGQRPQPHLQEGLLGATCQDSDGRYEMPGERRGIRSPLIGLSAQFVNGSDCFLDNPYGVQGIRVRKRRNLTVCHWVCIALMSDSISPSDNEAQG